MLVIAHRGASAAYRRQHRSRPSRRPSPRGPTGSSSTCGARPTGGWRCQPRRHARRRTVVVETAFADLPDDVTDLGDGARRVRAAGRRQHRDQELARRQGLRPDRAARRGRWSRCSTSAASSTTAATSSRASTSPPSTACASWPRPSRTGWLLGLIEDPRDLIDTGRRAAVTSPCTPTTRSSPRTSSRSPTPPAWPSTPGPATTPIASGGWPTSASTPSSPTSPTSRSQALGR